MIEGSSRFDPERLLNGIHDLSLEDFTKLMNLINCFKSEYLVKFYLKWIHAQKEDFIEYKNLILKIDFSRITQRSRLSFYLNIVTKLDAKLTKAEYTECRNHIFKVDNREINFEELERKLWSGYRPHIYRFRTARPKNSRAAEASSSDDAEDDDLSTQRRVRDRTKWRLKEEYYEMNRGAKEYDEKIRSYQNILPITSPSCSD